jgi:hypothetical protein
LPLLSLASQNSAMPPVAINSCKVNLPKGPGEDDTAADDLLNRPNTRD